MIDNSRCQCQFRTHHSGPCGASGVYAIGKASRLTLCRECLEYLVGHTEAAKRERAGVKNQQDTTLATMVTRVGKVAEIAAVQDHGGPEISDDDIPDYVLVGSKE